MDSSSEVSMGNGEDGMNTYTRVRISNIREKIFYLCLILQIINDICTNSLLPRSISYPYSLTGIPRYVCLILIFTRIYRKREVRKIALYFFMLAIAFISHSTSSSFVLFNTVVFGWAAMDYDYSKVLNIFEKTVFFSTVGIILLDAVNFLPRLAYQRYEGTGRVTLGFTHPNVLSMYILAFCCSYYFRRNEYNKRDLIPGALCLYITYELAKSYTVSAMIIAILIAVFVASFLRPLYRWLQSFTGILKWIGFIGIPVTVIVIVYFVGHNSQSNMLASLGATAALRLKYGNMGLSMYPPVLFGQRITTYNSIDVMNNSFVSYFMVDCLYILLLIRDGIIASICYLGIFISSFYKFAKKKLFMPCVIMALLMVYSFMENGVSFVSFLFVFIAAFSTNMDLANEKNTGRE